MESKLESARLIQLHKEEIIELEKITKSRYSEDWEEAA